MANHAVLNNDQHKDLRIITTRAAEYGDNVMCTLTFPHEFRSIQAHYPIFFRKDPTTGSFQPVAMFGFEENENLFLNSNGWDAAYLPLTMERQPFLIGFQNQQPVIHVDLDNPRISSSEGEAVFLEHGGYTNYLERMNSVLRSIHEGVEDTQAFVDELLSNELLESFTLDVELNDGSSHRLAGFYTINEEKLTQLSGETLAALSQKGHLLPIFMVIASMSQIRELIERRNEQLSVSSAP